MKTPLTALLSILLLQSFAQQNFQPGSVQKTSGETINGWIDYRAWERNPKSIRFKENENGTAITFTVDELSSFQVTGKESYKKAIVLKDMRPVDIMNVNSLTRDTTVTDTAFLRVISEGQKLGLYELNDDKTHYFIRDSTGAFQELIYKVYSTGSQLHYRHTYRDQLRVYGKNDPKLVRRLEGIQYDEDGIGPIVNAINGSSATATKSQRAKAVFFVSGGVSLSTLKTEGLVKLEGMEYTSSIAPTFGVGVDIVSNRRLGALALRFEALYTSADFKGTSKLTNSSGDEVEREYLLKMTNISPALLLLYSPFRAPSYRVYVGLGVSYNFTSYSKNIFREVNKSDFDVDIIDDYLGAEKSWLSVPVQLGAAIKNFDIIFSTKLLGTFERLINLETRLNIFSLRGAYRF